MLGPSAAIRTLGLSLLAVTLVAPDALAADRDKDGLRDGFETRHGVTSPNLKDGVEDHDNDGKVNKLEQYQLPIAKRSVEQSLRRRPRARVSGSPRCITGSVPRTPARWSRARP